MIYICPVPDMSSRIRKWQWMAKRYPDEIRKIFRHSLVTAIVLDEKRRREILTEVRKGLQSNDIESLMIDSGGFQVLKRQLYAPEEMIRINCELYQKYDYASNYVLPDCPPVLNETLASTKEKIKTSIDSALQLFNMLPERIQKKCMPVFHIRDTEDLDRQVEAYKHIVDISGKCCWASLRTSAGSMHRLSPLNIDLLTSLQKKLPSIKVHALGIGSRQAMYCLNRMGVYSSDSTSPTKTAFKHEVIFGFNEVHSDDTEEIRKHKESTGHECSSCDDPIKLKNSWVHRCVHNLLSMEDLPQLFNKTSPEQFVEMFPSWSDRIQTKGSQMAFF